MMDGSHASHCEKIIARCRQLRQRGGRPKPRERTNTQDPCVSEPAEPRTFIFTCDARELIAVNSCAGCKVGAVVALFYITNTPFSPHSSPFPRNLNQKNIFFKNARQKGFQILAKSTVSTLLIIACFVVAGVKKKKKASFYQKDNYGESWKCIWFIYSGLSRGFRLINCSGGSPRKTYKFHTFLQLACVFGKRFLFDSASQEMFMCVLFFFFSSCCRRAKS